MISDEDLITKLTSMSELELQPIMEQLIDHLDKNGMSHLLNSVTDDDFDELVELLEKAKAKLEEIENDADNIRDDARDMAKKISKAL